MNYYYTTSSVSNAAAGGILATLGALIFIPIIISLAISVVVIIALYKIFKKAGKQGWEAIIPIYNFITLFQIVGINPLFVIGLAIPVLNIIVAIGAYLRLAQGFGKSTGFVVGLILVPYIFLPMLAFGKDSNWDATKIDLRTMDFLNNKDFNPASSNPAQSAGSAAPETPFAPAAPGATTTFATTATQTTPATPMTPATPVAPATPETPIAPASPVAPETPATPTSPVTPAAPTAPAAPAAPVAPEAPTNPSDPTQTL